MTDILLSEAIEKCCSGAAEETAAKWAPKKLRSETLVSLYSNMGHEKKSNTVSTCANFLEFSLSEDSKAKLHNVFFCKDRFCPICVKRRSMKMFSQISQVVSQALKDDPKMRFLFLTLTVKNVQGEDLQQAFRELKQGAERLTDRAPWKKAVLGSIKVFECTHNDNKYSKSFDTYHPHIHMLLAVPGRYFYSKSGLYITQQKWADMWQQCCRLDYEPSIDIRPVKANGNMAKAVAEVAKYPIKDTDYLSCRPEGRQKVFETYYGAFSKMRQTEFLGIFRKYRTALKQDDIDNGDLLHIEDEEEKNVEKGLFVKAYWNKKSACYKMGKVYRKGEESDDFEQCQEPGICPTAAPAKSEYDIAIEAAIMARNAREDLAAKIASTKGKVHKERAEARERKSEDEREEVSTGNEWSVWGEWSEWGEWSKEKRGAGALATAPSERSDTRTTNDTRTTSDTSDRSERRSGSPKRMERPKLTANECTSPPV